MFCGRPGLTLEHIFSRRLAEAVSPALGPYQHSRGDLISGTVTRWEHYESDLKVRCVCSACNGGWMQELDAQVGSVLTHAAAGLPVSLRKASERVQLATWLYKVVLIAEQMHRQPLIEAERYAWFYEARRPPDDVEIWLARTIPRRLTMGVWRKAETVVPVGDPLDDSDPVNVVVMLVIVNQFVAGVYIPLAEAPAGLTLDSAVMRNDVRFIWPLDPVVVSWPPETVIPIDDIRSPAFKFPMTGPWAAEMTA